MLRKQMNDTNDKLKYFGKLLRTEIVCNANNTVAFVNTGSTANCLQKDDKVTSVSYINRKTLMQTILMGHTKSV